MNNLVIVAFMKLESVFISIVFKVSFIMRFFFLGIKLLSLLMSIVIEFKLVNLYNVKVMIVLVFLFKIKGGLLFK